MSGIVGWFDRDGRTPLLAMLQGAARRLQGSACGSEAHVEPGFGILVASRALVTSREPALDLRLCVSRRRRTGQAAAGPL
ncbi:MAG: hypothetical protein L0221_16410 [Chloroflexi bacterium]|nr:hypothetical protein [Chloroflexota bacterium]